MRVEDLKVGDEVYCEYKFPGRWGCYLGKLKVLQVQGDLVEVKLFRGGRWCGEELVEITKVFTEKEYLELNEKKEIENELDGYGYSQEYEQALIEIEEGIQEHVRLKERIIKMLSEKDF